MFRRHFLILFIIVGIVSLLSACAGGPADTPTPSPATLLNPSTPLALDTSDSGTCSEAETTPQTSLAPRPWHFVVITHGRPNSKFWAVVKKGVEQAAADLRVQVVYESPDPFDLDAMAQMIDDAVADHPDGIAVSVPDVERLRDPIQKAIAAGIPVVSLNSGGGVAETLGVLGHFGQSEYTAGTLAGQKLAEAGAHNGLCLIPEADNTALAVRCQGFADALVDAGQVLNQTIATDDPAALQKQIVAVLAQHPEVDAILALSPSMGEAALAALREQGLLGQVKLASFDLSPEMLQALQAGDVLFLVDQQPYLQGYLPILYLTLHKDNLSVPAAQVTLTGPTLVTRENAAQMLKYAQEQMR